MDGEFESVGVGWDLEVHYILSHKIKATDSALDWLGRRVLDHFDGQSDIQDGIVVQFALFVESDKGLQVLHHYLE